jgi:hypothetical protein
MNLIPIETLQMHILVGVLVLTGIVFLLYQSEEARIKKTLEKELPFKIPGFQTLSQYTFYGSGQAESRVDAFSSFGSCILFTTVQTCSTEDISKRVLTTFKDCGFQTTIPVRRNGGIYTFSIQRKKSTFTVSLCNSLHCCNSFFLGLEKVPVSIKE